MWEWKNDDPFGNNAPNEDPSNTGTAFKYNNRFPGQYFDAETGTHQNGFRDYDPSGGRYIQSDLIGLDGGLNTYGYVGGSPLNRTDPKGLSWGPWCVLDPGNMDCYDPDRLPPPRPAWVPPDKPQDPRVSCVITCLTKKAEKTVVVSGITYAAAYVAVTLAAPEISVPVTIIVVAVKKQYGIYYMTAKIVWTVSDCVKQCQTSTCP